MDEESGFLKLFIILVGSLAGYAGVSRFIVWMCGVMGDIQGAEAFSNIVGMGLFVLGMNLLNKIMEFRPGELKEKIIDNRKKMACREYAYQIPHFGEKLTYKQIISIIKKDKFVPYVNARGKKAKWLQVNEADKWVRILDQYYPLDLIYGYNIDRNVLYAIDGTEFELPEMLTQKYIDHDLKRFLEDRGCFYEGKLDNDFTHFFEVFPGYKNELPKADWSYIRYKWEKAVALERSPKIVTRCSYRDFFGRVLSKPELDSVVKDIQDGRKELSELLYAEDYVNEYTLCNGVELLGMLDESYRLQGIDFLFECLRDVDEACFRIAMPQILRLPEEILEAQLEARAEAAYKDKDVLRLAGLLYLSKEINYSIQYIENINEASEEYEEVRKFIADEGEETAVPKGFDAGAYAYQEE